jgi:hypothetical protein
MTSVRVSNIEYPTRFAKDQITFKVPDNSRVYLFNLRTQFISQVAFKVGTLDTVGPVSGAVNRYNASVQADIASDTGIQNVDGTIEKKEQIVMRDYYMGRSYGADLYVTDGYSASEKTWIISNAIENIRFSQRICDVPAAVSSDEWGNLWYQEDQKQLEKSSYTFFADQVVYDAQLKDRFWGVKGTEHKIKIKYDRWPNNVMPDMSPITFPYTKYYNGVEYAVDFDRSEFLDYADSRRVSKLIMSGKTWLQRFADKKFLILFRPNHINSNPRILYGIPVADLRYHDSDKKR